MTNKNAHIVVKKANYVCKNGYLHRLTSDDSIYRMDEFISKVYRCTNYVDINGYFITIKFWFKVLNCNEHKYVKSTTFY